MLKRVVTGAAIFVLMCVGIVFQGWVLRIMLLAASLTAMNEMYRAIRHTGAKPAAWAGYVQCILASLLTALTASYKGAALNPNSAQGALAVSVGRVVSLEGLNVPAVALAVGALLGLSAIVLRGKVAYQDLSATVLPMVYPGFLFSLMMGFQDLPQPAATTALMLSLFLASVNDVFALFTGLKFGRHKLSPEISPKKTIEGSVGGMIASVAFSLLIGWVMGIDGGLNEWIPLGAQAALQPLPPLGAFAALGLVAGALSQIGDLTASLVKRHCGVKDYGAIFPGHGGMMDRFDGVLFCTAVVWLFFHLFAF